MSTPPRVSSVLPALRGHGLLLAAATDADRIRDQLHGAGFTVIDADLTADPTADGRQLAPASAAADHLDQDGPATSLRRAQAVIATALRLPEAATRNLDALVDSLRDLAQWWPESDRIVLLLHGAASLVVSDLPGWQTLTDILRAASQELWRDGSPGDRAFETIALVHQHGVPTLPEDPTTSQEGR